MKQQQHLTTRISAALFVFDESVDPAQLLAGLSPAERDRHAATAHTSRQRQYLGSRWLLRQHLAAELETSSRALTIDYPDGAAPRCADTAWHLGLSHSGPACLSVMADTSVGCDIEQHRARRFAPERLAEHCFHADETAALQTVPPANRQADFHRLWTLKEAGHKAGGLGLAAGMTRPSFALRPHLSCTRAPNGDDWCFAACDLVLPAGRFALAIATPRAEVTIDLTRIRPVGVDRLERTTRQPKWQIAACKPSELR